MTAQSSAVQGWNFVISSAAYCSGSGLRLTQALTPSAYACSPARVSRGVRLEGSLCSALQADRAKLDVARQSAGADQFGKRATGLSAQDVQLEQPVLCLHPALQDQGIVFVHSIDVRHAVDITQYSRREVQFRQRDGTVVAVPGWWVTASRIGHRHDEQRAEKCQA